MSKKNKSGGFFWHRYMYQSEAYFSLNRTAMIILNAFLDARKQNPNSKSKNKKQKRKEPDFINLHDMEMPYETLVKKYKLNRSSIPRGFDDLMAKGFIKIVYHGGAWKHDKTRYALIDDYLTWKPWMAPMHKRPKRIKRGYQGRRLGATETDEKFLCAYCGQHVDHVKRTNQGLNSCVDCLAEGSMDLSPDDFINHNAQNETLTHAQN